MHTILVIEDERDIREMIEVGLEVRGYHTLLADSGERALQIFQSQTVDAVISDIKMPGMGGVAAVSILRELDPDIPLIIVTGYLDPRAIDDCMKLGRIKLLRKPFEFHVLADAVASVLGDA